MKKNKKCPECESTKIVEDIDDPDYDTDGMSGFPGLIHTVYECLDCGFAWRKN